MIKRFGPGVPLTRSLTTGNFRKNIGASLTSNNFQTIVPKTTSGNPGSGSSGGGTGKSSPPKTSK